MYFSRSSLPKLPSRPSLSSLKSFKPSLKSLKPSLKSLKPSLKSLKPSSLASKLTTAHHPLSAASRVIQASCTSSATLTNVVARCWGRAVRGTRTTRGLLRGGVRRAVGSVSGVSGVGGVGGVGVGGRVYSTGAGGGGGGKGQGQEAGGGAGKAAADAALGSQRAFYRKLIHAWTSTPTKWYPLPIAVGALLLVVIQYRKNTKRARAGARDAGEVDVLMDDEEGVEVVRLRGGWHIHILAALPLRTTSRLWGYLNSLTLPVWFRPYGLGLYAWVFGCELGEAEYDDLRMYESLGAFFERRLKEGARPVEAGDEGGSVLVSPADGTILHFGTVQGSRVEQVKGITYSLDALLGVERYGGLGGESDAVKIANIPRNRERGMEVVDHEEFANVNGIEYSLGELLGTRGGKGREGGEGQGQGGEKEKGEKQHDASIPMREREKDEGLEETLVHDAAVAVQMGVRGVTRRSASVGDGSTSSGSSTALDTDTPSTPSSTPAEGQVPQPRARPRRSTTYSSTVKPGNALFFAVIYLAPGDYHRFHSPTAWVVEKRRHFVGELFSVSPFMAKRLEGLFVLNERVALMGRWRWGFFGMVPVGATNVGSIRVGFDQDLRTNAPHKKAQRKPDPGTYSEATYEHASEVLRGQPLAPGEEMGGFSLGSTIVLVFEAPRSFEFGVERGEKVRVGRRLGGVRREE